jgi:hypothetical protein
VVCCEHSTQRQSCQVLTRALEQHLPSPLLFQWRQEVKRLMQLHNIVQCEVGVVRRIHGRAVHVVKLYQGSYMMNPMAKRNCGFTHTHAYT